MEKRLLLAFVLSIIFFTFWSHLFPQQKTQAPLPQTSQQEIAPTLGKTEIIELIEEADIEYPTASIGQLGITYSPKGGYIKEISPKKNGEILLFKNIGFIPSQKDKEFKATITADKLVFKDTQGQQKEFIFGKDSLVIKIPANPPQMLLFSNYLSPNAFDQRYQEVFYSKDEQMKRWPPRKEKKEEINAVSFAGARGRYYCLALASGSYDIQWQTQDKRTDLYLDKPDRSTTLYLGLQEEKSLQLFGLQGVIYYGFWHSLSLFMIKVLSFFHAVTKSWGLSIILFSLAIYFLLFPFTMKSTKSMRMIQQIQPELEELKQKYKDNPQKLQKETLAIYQKYKINPLGGCLPLFFQFPIIIAFYQVAFRFVGLKGANFLWIKDLSGPDKLVNLGFKIPLLNISYINLLPILIMILGVLQQKTLTSPNASSQQKSMGLFMSVFIGIIFYNFPSSLVLYWFTQNILTFLYQGRLSKTQLLSENN